MAERVLPWSMSYFASCHCSNNPIYIILSSTCNFKGPLVPMTCPGGEWFKWTKNGTVRIISFRKKAMIKVLYLLPSGLTYPVSLKMMFLFPRDMYRLPGFFEGKGSCVVSTSFERESSVEWIGLGGVSICHHMATWFEAKPPAAVLTLNCVLVLESSNGVMFLSVADL